MRQPRVRISAVKSLVLIIATAGFISWSFSGPGGNMIRPIVDRLIDPAYAATISITDQPFTPNYSTSGTFSFTITPAGPTSCKIDGGSYADCASPITHTGLSAGSHTFYVADSGDLGSFQSYTWTILPLPTISSITPDNKNAGDPDFVLIVEGADFSPDSVVRWNSVNRPTTYVSPTQLSASITAADVASPGSADVTVYNPDAGAGGTSSSQTFTIGAPPPVPTGDSGNVTGWMWSRSAGWVSMNCSNFGTCNIAGYGVNLQEEDTGGGAPTEANLTGYAWSDDLGWICFGQTCPGPNPEGLANYAQWRVGQPPADPAERVACAVSDDCSPLEYCSAEFVCTPRGRIYGWAQVMSLGPQGWISLNCDNDVLKTCGDSNHFTVFDQGKFTMASPWPESAGPDPNNYHWAWSGNSDGTGLGWIDTSLVFADWAPPSLGRVLRPEGIYEPDIPAMPEEEKALHRPSKFQVTVEGIYCSSNNRLECEIGLPNGEKRFIGRNLGDLSHYGDSVTLEYTVTQDDALNGGIEQNKLWMINACRLAGKPLVDLPCTQDSECPAGRICDEEATIPDEVGVGFCRKISATTLKKPLYVHANAWTLFNDNEDYYQAIKCYAGFPGQFFENSTRCDFTGDASFSLAMSKGIPIKRDCHDRADSRGPRDCDDRFCSGISYFCTEHQPTRCVWDEAGGDLPRCSDIDYQRGGLCCSHQPVEDGSAFNSVVNGLECEYQDPSDGYFDCECTGPGASFAPDCYGPYYQPGDLCCTANSEVTIIQPE